MAEPYKADIMQLVGKEYDECIWLLADFDQGDLGWSTFVKGGKDAEEMAEKHEPLLMARLDMHHLMAMMTALDPKYQWVKGALKKQVKQNEAHEN